MTPLESDLEEVLLHLRHAQRAMRRFAAVTADWTARMDIETEFYSLRRACRNFARHQYGLDTRGRPRRA